MCAWSVGTWVLPASLAAAGIHQIWVSAALVPCIVDCGLLHHGASDHTGVWARLDLTKARTGTDDVWEYV